MKTMLTHDSESHGLFASYLAMIPMLIASCAIFGEEPPRGINVSEAALDNYKKTIEGIGVEFVPTGNCDTLDGLVKSLNEAGITVLIDADLVYAMQDDPEYYGTISYRADSTTAFSVLAQACARTEVGICIMQEVVLLINRRKPRLDDIKIEWKD